MKTEDLIQHLAATARPVERLQPPVRRALAWIGFAVIILGALALSRGLRADFHAQLARPEFLLEWLSSFATGVAAIVAAFYASLPDRSRVWLLLPVPPVVLWLASLGYGCLLDWTRWGSDGLAWGVSADCLRFIVLTSVPLTATLAYLLRHAWRLRPRATAALGALGAAALSATAVSTFHDVDAAMMVLITHLGTVAVVSLVAYACGRPLFRIASAGRTA